MCGCITALCPWKRGLPGYSCCRSSASCTTTGLGARAPGLGMETALPSTRALPGCSAEEMFPPLGFSFSFFALFRY